MNDITLKKPTNKLRLTAVFILLLAIGISTFYVVYRFREEARVKYAADFGFEDIKSPLDADGDGVDDYADLVIGAREYILTNPVYSSGYYAGGYPPDSEGVCTDVIWKAFKAAGYSLKDLVDKDIAENKDAYPKATDSNINFRRVRNLSVFFDRNAQSLTISLKNPEDWMPGDIVVTEGHIGICSDKRNNDGFPYIIHFTVAGAVEVDYIKELYLTGHYRWCPQLAFSTEKVAKSAWSDFDG